ncbi:MAG: glycosyltransferase family 87 protein, partial [Ktedonobacterales bacterium]
AIIATVSVEYIQPRGRFSDFADFYAAARGLRMGFGPEIYSPTQLHAIDQLPGSCAGSVLHIFHKTLQTPYVNPPLLAILLQPLTMLPCVDAFRVWRLISLAIWAAVILLLAWQVWHRCVQQGHTPSRAALAAAYITALAATAYPVLDGLWLGQVHLLIFAGIVLAWWLRKHNQPVAAGVVLAVITLIKLLPAVLIVYFLLRRDWRVVAGALVGGVLLLGVMVVGAGGLPTLLAMIPAFISVPTLLPEFNTTVLTLHPLLGPALAAGLGLTFAGTVLLLKRNGATEIQEDPALGYAWAICTMLVVSPIVWLHYLTWLLMAIAACLPHVRGWRQAVTLGVASLALMLSTPALPAVATVAMLLCWVLTGALYVYSSRPSTLTLTSQRQLALAGDTLS